MKELGNPALIAAASSPAVREAARDTTLRVKRDIGFIGKGLLIVGGIVATRIALRNIARNKILKDIYTNPNYRAATRIYDLLPANMKTSASLLSAEGIIANIISMAIPTIEKDKTDQILNVAKEITDFGETTKAFKGLYREDLRLCLEKVLTPHDLEVFYNYTRTHKVGDIKVEPAKQDKYGYRVVTTSETSLLAVSKSAIGKLTKPIQLSRNVPANTSCGTFEGATVKNVRQNDNRKFYVCKFGKSGKYTVYILVSTKSSKLVQFSKTHSYKTIGFKPTTGEVTKIS